MDKIKIGIIGVGYIAGVHAAILSTDERVQVTAVHDVVDERARVFAAAHARGAWQPAHWAGLQWRWILHDTKQIRAKSPSVSCAQHISKIAAGDGLR